MHFIDKLNVLVLRVIDDDGNIVSKGDGTFPMCIRYDKINKSSIQKIEYQRMLPDSINITYVYS